MDADVAWRMLFGLVSANDPGVRAELRGDRTLAGRVLVARSVMIREAVVDD